MTVFIQRVQVHGMYTLSCGPEVAVVLFAVLICCLLKDKLTVTGQLLLLDESGSTGELPLIIPPRYHVLFA